MSIMEIFADMVRMKPTTEETYSAMYTEITGIPCTLEEAEEALKPNAAAVAPIHDDHDHSGLIDEY